MLKKRKIITRISLSTDNGEFDGGKGRDVILEGYRTSAEITDISRYSGGNLSNTVIPAGSLTQDANGYLYASTHAGTIPRSDQVDIHFSAKPLVRLIPSTPSKTNNIWKPARSTPSNG